MDMESMAKLMQVLMSSNDSDNSGGNGEAAPQNESAKETGDGNDENGGDFSGIFDNINFDMLSKMGELFSRMNRPDRNAELLLALKPHLRIENQHKVDSAMKLSRMMSMLPFLKESGILNDLF
ncbi:MAG: hypothetical protein FWH07_02835 [Oscillospiraceae bacterium]|nr:hypothetical protein [Oscillospiraceae bacterium]